jgi:pyridoxine 4-dehydrogenase
MTPPGQQTDSRTPAPGGTAKLAGRTVARVGFGVMQLGRQPRDPSLAILRQAVGAGVNHLDTAHFYGPCNAYSHDALAPYPEDLVLVSKAGADRDPDDEPVPAQRPEQLARRSRPTSPRSAPSRSTWSTCGDWTSSPA